MDEPGAGLVHGCLKRWRDLETVLHRDWSERALFWWIQSARVRHLFGLIVADHQSAHRFVKIGCGSSSAQTGGKRADDPIAKGTPETASPVQETNHSVFRFVRPQPIGTIVSLGTHGD